MAISLYDISVRCFLQTLDALIRASTRTRSLRRACFQTCNPSAFRFSSPRTIPSARPRRCAPASSSNWPTSPITTMLACRRWSPAPAELSARSTLRKSTQQPVAQTRWGKRASAS